MLNHQTDCSVLNGAPQICTCGAAFRFAMVGGFIAPQDLGVAPHGGPQAGEAPPHPYRSKPGRPAAKEFYL